MRHKPSGRMVRTEFGLHQDQSPEKRKTTAHSKLRKATRYRIRTLGTHGSRPYVKTNVTGKGHMGGWEDDDGAIHGAHRVQVGNPGEADLEVTWFGQSFMFEIKAGDDVQRPVQAKIERLFTAAGGIYLIVRAPHEATDAMLQWAARTGKIV
jgi:hypothetical protein